MNPANRLVFTATDRPQYFQPVMDTWQNARGYADWQPTVYLEPTCLTVIMDGIARGHDADVHHNTSRLGVLKNPWHALESAFNTGADFVVLAEDDVLVSSDILEYFTWAADQFRDQPVLAVCACSFEPTCPPHDQQSVVTHQRFCSLVWATWRDRWIDTLRNTWDHDYTSGTPAQPQSGWDWNINLRILPGTDLQVVTPLASRSSHIGEHHGTHTSSDTFPGSVAHTFHQDRPPAPFHLKT